jgi:hypothetical protein
MSDLMPSVECTAVPSRAENKLALLESQGPAPSQEAIGLRRATLQVALVNHHGAVLTRQTFGQV